ncbi:MAG: hypothetical protein A3A72_04690, partial [Deltaproteobacteria bacterium RIFCSPLOWO2_01_FULL_38_9]
SSFPMKQWGPVILWCALIFYSSHHPVPEPFTEAHTFPGVDILYHLFIYGMLGFLCFRAFKNLIFSFLFCVLYGLSDEIHQYWMTFRSFEIHDLLMDAVGGILGSKIYEKIIR